jgi:hypothetical protein
MIHRFREVVPGVLYRGSAPSPLDVKELKNKLGIKKIVSLDKDTGEKIDRACKLLDIEHIKMYIDTTNAKNQKKHLLRLLTRDLRRTFLEEGPTFVHCLHGKDRTGLVCAIIECKFFGESPEKAIHRAKSLGFGIGVPPEVVHLYESVIKSCKPLKDDNSADIVGNEREYISDNRSSMLDEAYRHSFAPYLDTTRTDAPYNSINDQSMTRSNYKLDELLDKVQDYYQSSTIPDVGVFNNDAGMMAAGPTLNQTGFVYA